MTKIEVIKGMSDILPPQSDDWRRVQEMARQGMDRFGFSEIITPIVESTDLFTRSVGKTSDIVEKQMYSFQDKKGLALTLRPEATASVVRAYIESGLAAKEPLSKFYYWGPMFRYEQPQKGRSRQFYQLGTELLGAAEPAAEVEVIFLLTTLLKSFGISNFRLEINSLGNKKCLADYMKEMKKFLKGIEKKIPAEYAERSQKNPLRILDAKDETCRALMKEAPLISEFWDGSSRDHFGEVKNLLKGASVSFKENPRIVRGLDYYCHTTFEALSPDLGAQDAVAAGGRYDGLVKDLGGPDLPGVGFAMGIERIMLLRERTTHTARRTTEIFFALLGSSAQKVGLPLIQKMRDQGKSVEFGFGGSLKSQMRRAQKLGVPKVVILGENEVQTKKCLVKNMETGDQQEVSWDSLGA